MIVFILIVNLYSYIQILLKLFNERKRPKPGTHHINKFYEASVFLEFIALGDVFDIVAPYNVISIPNNFFWRFIMPKSCG